MNVFPGSLVVVKVDINRQIIRIKVALSDSVRVINQSINQSIYLNQENP